MASLACKLACTPRLSVAWALPSTLETLINDRLPVSVGILPWLSSAQPRRYRPAALTRLPSVSGVKLPARVYSSTEELMLGETTKKPLPEIDRSVGEEVVIGRPCVVTSWPITAVTPAEAPPLRPVEFRKVEKLAVACL